MRVWRAADLRCLFSLGLLQVPVCIIVSQFSRTVENGKRAVGITVNAHF